MKPADFKIHHVPTLVREQALKNLRSAIVGGFYQPGDRLIERELCEIIGVSRTSIREVLRQLEAERLIKVEPRKGLVVASISLREAKEIYEIRALLEGSAASAFAIKATNREVTALHKACGDFERAAERNDLPRMIKAMSRFYDVLFSGAGNSVMFDVLKSLHARISFLRGTSMSQSGRIKHSVAEIKRIVDAIVERDARAAKTAAADHVAEAARTAIARLEAPE